MYQKRFNSIIISCLLVLLNSCSFRHYHRLNLVKPDKPKANALTTQKPMFVNQRHTGSPKPVMKESSLNNASSGEVLYSYTQRKVNQKEAKVNMAGSQETATHTKAQKTSALNRNQRFGKIQVDPVSGPQSWLVTLCIVLFIIYFIPASLLIIMKVEITLLSWLLAFGGIIAAVLVVLLFEWIFNLFKG